MTIENRKLSNLSKTPPWPGINLLEFLRLFFLLKYDSIISPTKADKINKKIKPINCVSIVSPNNKANKLVKKNERNNPPKKPSIVLLGLNRINLLRPNILPIKYENISNDETAIINRLKVLKISFVKLILKKKINEIIIYINGINL